MIDSVLAGFNGTVLAYGQTSAGKVTRHEGSLAIFFFLVSVTFIS